MTMTRNTKDTMTGEEARAAIGVSHRMFERYVKAGRVRKVWTIHNGTAKRRFTRDSVERLADARKQKQKP